MHSRHTSEVSAATRPSPRASSSRPASGIVIVSVHPGYVDTDMTQGKATPKPEDSVMAMVSLIDKLNHESTGKFFNLDPQIPLAELPCNFPLASGSIVRLWFLIH
ncbi:hypothetical protein PPTG_19582 [Phytophthora nicotianae INRA-310]|uniref:C-factor n=1 Tax=Phytophthora nicotianae (strain INRA-310) TaxID=761204 RepID=W2PDS5_PHYN3|nr:hypothetical protein PPTG_19582 [Phytophthora nicotianae INRA-310]ETM98343.1 hypothetical protein PPTG_19582 [Phytophthora nicotianae INRA-310]